MIGSLFAGMVGLNVNSTSMTVLGDNISNVNTTGFKSNRSSFANILSSSLAGSVSSDVGRGVQFQGTTPMWTQGTIENTNNPTDMAINGSGFFVVQDDTGANFYTRAGEFTFDRNGDLVNMSGLYVQGYEVTGTNPDGSLILGAVTNINASAQGASPPFATDSLSVDVNLDSATADLGTYATTTTVYDSLGNAIPLTLTFTKSVAPPANTWTAVPTVPPTVAAAASVTMTNGTFSFDAFGNLNAVVAPAGNPVISIDPLISGAAPLSITWDVYDATLASNGSITQYSSPSGTTYQTQNGYPSGTLRTVDVNEEGVVTGAYSNGQLTPLFQLVMADFPSYYGLTKMGKNLYSESLESGPALFGTPQSGRLGSISTSAIEMSNVDLAAEFVKLITTQRAFQANSRVITTSDEILNELINLKR
ncbi:MAG: flagellar hook protein FlgE [Deltaproteobacteria bacterium]|jgi:flagellar hook protein FlgE|nr:flagellar hook protein FlgE [Deltaproteobacteria bacterium]